jgi:alanine racemase
VHLVAADRSCPPSRPAWAEIDLDAVAHNVRVLRAVAAPAAVWAVVKADGYGHGAVPVGRAALGAGAAGLAVALVEEGASLRAAGVRAPILVLSEPAPNQYEAAVAHGLEVVVYSARGVDGMAAAARRLGHSPAPLHLKVDTGMHRVGAPPEEAVALARRICGDSAVTFAGLMTHLAVADEPDDPYTAAQLDRLDAVSGELAEAGLVPRVVHAANSAGAFAHERARRSFVRAGISVYGLTPGPGVAHLTGALRPALSLKARVSHVQRVRAGDRISYGLRHRFAADSTVATLPLGYADGVPRRLSSTGGEVLVGGRRRPVVGVVTMDQLMVDCGDDAVSRGDEAVLIGVQGSERITADEWAERLDTISYEITCGISARVPRRYSGGPGQA